MGKRIKLQNTTIAKVGDGVGHLVKGIVELVGNYKEKFLGAGLLLLVADNIRVRFGRRKDQKAFEESSVKQ